MASRDVVKKAVMDVALFAASQVALYYALRYVMSSLDPAKDKRSSAKSKSSEVLSRLGLKDVKLTEYEEIIAAEVVHPEDINVRFDDIGGLDPIISSLRESVIYPLVYPSLFTPEQSASGDSSPHPTLLAPPKGVLLYGPPGCGKTLLARALAAESHATFINLPISALTDKWYGESNKLVRGLFGLARKLQPSIIFIDEIDCFLRERGRGGGDHEVTGMMKAEFMTLWDGLLTQSDRILVLGATNRPGDIDQAILRRMPKRFAISLPDVDQRAKILQLMLPATFPPHQVRILAERTTGMSGSDLKELCRNAAMVPLREFMRERGTISHEEMMKRKDESLKLRPLTLDDFFVRDGTDSMLSLNPTRTGIAADLLD